MPESAAVRGPARRAAVFYNAGMALDRDLNVAVAVAVGRLGRGWEMMAATGVRSLRVANESGRLDALVLSERRAEALGELARNVRLFPDQDFVVVRHDAHAPVALRAFDYVDLDPYGTPAPYLDAALAALRLPGILAVTATDMRVLAGAEPGVAQRRYGGAPLRGRLGPEGGLRLLLAHVAVRAQERGLRVRPLLAYVRDHHVRAYLRVELDGEPAPPLPIARIDPASWTGPRVPADSRPGPMWLGPLFSGPIVEALAVPESASRPVELARLIERFRGEVPCDRPFFFESNVLAKEEHLERPPAPDQLIEALRSSGWHAARTHAREGAFRTDAPRSEVVRVARAPAR